MIGIVLAALMQAAPAPAPMPELPKPPSTFDPVFYYAPGAIQPIGNRADWMKMLVPFMREGGMRRLVIIIDTDTVGSAEANRALTVRRGQLLTRWFVEAGIPESAIEVQARGEDEAPVQTGDEVSEPLNRRAGLYMQF